MFNDWEDENAGSSLEELLSEYERIKKGEPGRFLEEEEYKQNIVKRRCMHFSFLSDRLT